MAKEINWNTVLVVLVIGVVGILLLSNSGILSGAFSKDVTGAWGSCYPIGTCTSGKIVKWSGISSLTNSVITEYNGNVGIGITTIDPGAKLQVADDVKGIMISNAAGNNNQLLIRPGGTAGSSTEGSVVIAHKSLKGNIYIRSREGAEIGASGDIILNDGYGNVGIGTTTPRTKLDIGGNLNVGTNLYVDGHAEVFRTLTVHDSLKVSADAEINGGLVLDNLETKKYLSGGQFLCINNENIIYKSDDPCVQ